jgi:tetratricopeptide (TPR) repeat protein
MNRRLLPWVVFFVSLQVLAFLVLSRFVSNLQASPGTTPVAPSKLINENLASGRLMQTIYQAESLAAQSGWTRELAQVVAQTWEDLGDLPRATQYWQIAAEFQSDNAGLVRHLAQLYIDLQRWTEAGETLRQLVRIVPDDNRAHYDLGLIEAAYDPRSAGDHLRLAARDLPYRDLVFELLPFLDADKMDSQNAMQLGLLLAGHDLWQYAELAFDQAAALGDPFPEALAYLGLARDKQGKDGSELVSRALALAPDNAQILYLRGLHLRALYDYPASLESFAKAMAFDPENPAYAAELATAYNLLGNLGQAEAWLKTAVTLSHDDPRFQGLLNDFYATLPSN